MNGDAEQLAKAIDRLLTFWQRGQAGHLGQPMIDELVALQEARERTAEKPMPSGW